MWTWRSTPIAALVLLGGSACGDGPLTTDSSDEPAETRISSGDHQIRFPESTLGDVLWVQAYDAAGAELRRSGLAVTWTVTSGGGNLTTAESSTNGLGSASASWRLGETLGDQSLEVSVSGTPSVTFTARAAEPGPILFTSAGSGTTSSERAGIYSVNPDGSDPVLVRSANALSADRSPDGSAIIVSLIVDRLSPALISLPQLAAIPFAYQNTRATDFAWSPDGSQVSFYVWRGGAGDDCHDRRIWVAQSDGTSPTAVSPGTPCINERDADWSPDGSKLVFQSAVGGDFVNAIIWTMGSDGSSATPVATGPIGHRPRWLPDGRRVVVGGYERGGSNSLRIVDTITGEQEIVWSPEGLATVLPGGISPDGQFAVVEATFDGESSDVYTIDLMTGGAFNVTNRPDVDDYFPSWWSGAP